jgi:hypothetical protein
MLDVVPRPVVKDLVWLRVILRARRFIDFLFSMENLRVARRRSQQKKRP